MLIDAVIIGYGNRLRGDDGLGPAAAAVVQSWQLPRVRVVIVPQLLPELIEDMKDAGRVLFIDAAASGLDRPFAYRVVEPTWSRSSLGHHEAPGNLLALLRDLEGVSPSTGIVTIAADSFAHGEGLSESARDNMQAALAAIRGWLTRPSCTKSV